MDQVHVIRHKVLVEGQSARSVAREMRVSRNTVRKYLRESAPVRRESPARARPARLFGLTAEQVSPAALIQALLKAEVELLWFGGIGTYVKARVESHADVESLNRSR